MDIFGNGSFFFPTNMELIDQPYFGSLREVLVKSRTFLQNLEQFTDHSWQDYLKNMSCQGTRADAIIIQAVANCLYLSIHNSESFETFAPVTVVRAVIVTGEYTNIYIGHISETNSLLRQLFLTLATSSYKIADQSELISHTLATGLWRLLKYTIKTGMIYSHVVTCTW